MGPALTVSQSRRCARARRGAAAGNPALHHPECGPLNATCVINMLPEATALLGGNTMNLSEIQDFAIQARIALIVGVATFDRAFAGIRFAEIDGSLLYVYARDEESAMEIEDNFALYIAIVASRIVCRYIDFVVVLPKVLQ